MRLGYQIRRKTQTNKKSKTSHIVIANIYSHKIIKLTRLIDLEGHSKNKFSQKFSEIRYFEDG